MEDILIETDHMWYREDYLQMAERFERPEQRATSLRRGTQFESS